MSGGEKMEFWEVKHERNAKPLAAYKQISRKKAARPSKKTARVAYPVHMVGLSSSAMFRQWLIEYGHTVVVVLSVAGEEEWSLKRKEWEPTSTVDYFKAMHKVHD